MKLLCATDLRPKSDAAVDRAYQLREALTGSLKLLHVVPPVGIDQGTLEQRLLSASSRLAQRARHAGGAPVELVVRCGRPASVMRDEAGSASVIVVGPHDPDTRVDALRSDFTARVLTEVRRPMLIVRRPAKQPYRRMLLALDGSRATGQVVRMAERMPMADDVALAAVHAHEPPYEAMMTTAGVGNLSVASYSSASMEQAASRIHAQLRLHSRAARRYRVLLLDARPAPAIRAAIREIGPDLLVLGTRGHGRLRRALLGSTAHEVLQSVDCDVLLVPEAVQGPAGPADTDPRAA